MSHIVAFESRQAHDVEGSVYRLDSKAAEGLVLSLRDVFNVVISRDLEVLLLNAEVKIWEVGAAYGISSTTVDGVVDADSCKKFLHNTFIPKIGDQDVRCRNVKNGVHAFNKSFPKTCVSSTGNPERSQS